MAKQWVVKDPDREDVFWPSEEMKRRAWVSDPKIYEEAARDPIRFWEQRAREGIHWYRLWEKPYEWAPPYVKWFIGGKLNACYNALDRHLEAGRGEKTALIWVPEPPDEPVRKFTYRELYELTNKFANVLKSLGVKRGDRVGIYLPLIPELYPAILACARIGAIHTVVFSAFSADSLRVRLEDAEAKVLITADGYYRRGKLVNLKAGADEGVKGTKVEKVVVVRRAGNPVNMVEGRDHWWHELMEKAEPYCPPEQMDSEDVLFLLYTSGCCHGDSLLQLSDGEVKKISEVVEGNEHRDIISVCPDSLRNVHDGIAAVHRYDSPGLLYKIKTTSAEGTFTPNHILFSLDKDGNILEKEARELRKGDYVFVVPKVKVKGTKQPLPPLEHKKHDNAGEFKPSNVPNIPVYLTESFAQILGYLTGDGHTDQRSLIFTDGDLDTLRFYTGLIERELGLKSIIAERGGRQRAYVNSSLLVEYIEAHFPECVLRSPFRSVPRIIQRSEDACLRGFLRGLFDAEGTIGEAFVKLSTTSESLARTVQMLLRRFGILSSVYEGKQKPRIVKGHWVKETGIFNLQISDRESLETFAREIGFSAPRKREKLLQLTQRLASRGVIERRRFPVSKLLRRAFEIIRIPNRDAKELGLYPYVYGLAMGESKLRKVVAYLKERMEKISAESSDPEGLERLASALKIRWVELARRGKISMSHLYKIRRTQKQRLNKFWDSVRSYILEKKAEKLDELRKICEKFERMLQFEAILEKVTDVEEIVDSSFVYDLTAKRNHTYIVDGFVTHNTTGRPKGVIHTTGGYLVQAYWTTKWVFDLHDDDIFWCTSDIGWITGHTYACYGPLLNGATFLVYEGAPDYPTPDRIWEIIEKQGVTVFYTAPTLIRMLMQLGDEWPKKHDLSSLRLLGTVGEPIDRKAWMWYFNVVGGGRCPITDTWWQTETGGTLIMSLPGIGPFMPTVAGKSFPGTIHTIVDEDGKETEVGYLVQVPPIAPGMLRGLWRADDKYRETYWERYNYRYYLTNDGALRAPLGCIRVTGRVDDVMKVAGHRLATGEVEDAVNTHPLVAESAVVPKPHEIKGEVPVVFAVLKPGATPSPQLEEEIKKIVRQRIGPTATPEQVVFVPDLPKTRSGKIMRRILKALLTGSPVGDTTTLVNPEVVETLKQIVKP